MTTLSITEARKNLFNLVDQVALSHEPALLTGKRANAVLVSEEDWQAIQETLHLVSIPGMKQSLQEGMATPTDQCDETLDW